MTWLNDDVPVGYSSNARQATRPIYLPPTQAPTHSTVPTGHHNVLSSWTHLANISRRSPFPVTPQQTTSGPRAHSIRFVDDRWREGDVLSGRHLWTSRCCRYDKHLVYLYIIWLITIFCTPVSSWEMSTNFKVYSTSAYLLISKHICGYSVNNVLLGVVKKGAHLAPLFRVYTSVIYIAFITHESYPW